MNDTPPPSTVTTSASLVTKWLHMPASLWQRHRIIALALASSFLVGAYWLLIASDRYVSEAHIVVQRTDTAGAVSADLTSLISGASNAERTDQLLLRDHLLSPDMLRKLDEALKLRAHYSDSRRDPLTRLWFQDASMEWFHRHYQERVSIEFDEYAGILLIKAQAYDPKIAHAITSLLVQEGERFMNDLARQLARDQVAFLESEVARMHQRVTETRRAVVDYQSRKGMASPQASAESLAVVVANLEGQRTALQTQRAALQAYLVPNHPNIVQLNQQIAAVEHQIAQEQGRIAGPNGKTLTRSAEEFQRLEMEALFAVEVF